MYKDAVLNLSSDVKNDRTIGYSLVLAREFSLHLAAVSFAYEAVPAAMLADDISADFIDRMQKQAEDNAKAAVATFEQAAREAAISIQAQWITASFAGTADLFGRIARRFDLSIVRQPEPDKNTPDAMIVESALFDSGRPVVVVPYIQTDPPSFKRALVCWDGSHNAARAVGDALPFLKRA